MDALTTASQKLSQILYEKAAQEQQAQAGQAQPDAGPTTSAGDASTPPPSDKGDDVIDADFEVKE